MVSLAGRGANDLDDLVQTAAELVFRKFASFEGRSELTTWINAICYRVLLSQRRWYRRWRVRFSLGHDDVERESEDPLPGAELDARERARSVHAALARMSDKYRAVVVLHDMQELSVKEISTIVNCNELTVRSRLRDGRKQLVRLLERDTTSEQGGRHELNHSR